MRQYLCLDITLIQKQEAVASRHNLLSFMWKIEILVVFGLKLEVALRMLAHRTKLRSLLADNDVATVAALPDAVAIA